eukprot:g2165.t1
MMRRSVLQWQNRARRTMNRSELVFHRNQVSRTVLHRNLAKLQHFRTQKSRFIISKRHFSANKKSSSGGERSTWNAESKEGSRNTALYLGAVVVGVVGIGYAFVPLYTIFCQATGFGGETIRSTIEEFKKVQPRETNRLFRITFNSDIPLTMPWKFKPIQKSVKLVPGETALAFYRAQNKSDKPVTGIATYNVTPLRAGIYFHKIQCFCFDEQRLEAGEEVDMPVFFYIDPEILDDPLMTNVNTITLSYTFFNTTND